MRCFIAIAVPEELKEKILEVQNKLKQAGANLKLVERENLHFTVKFLGEIEENQIKEVKEFLASLEEKSFEISIKGLGVFPTEDYIKVVWLGVEKNQDVFLNLIKKINKNLDKIRKEKKELNTHLTIARVRSAKNKNELKAAVQDLKETEIGEMQVNSLKLISSELTPEGPKYTELAEFELK